MKCIVFVVLFALIGSNLAEPPRFKSARLRSSFFARQEAAPETDPTTATADDAPYPPASAPYPPSGWKPSGQAFELPTETTEAPVPDNAYGPPEDAYGPPKNEYGPPSADDGSTEILTVGPEAETPTEAPATSGKLRFLKSQRLIQRQPDNSFYILLPDNTLQKIDVGRNGARVNSRFSARLLQEVPRNSRF